MIKLLGISACALFCAIFLKDKNRIAAVAVSTVGACILLFSAASQLRDIINNLEAATSSVAATSPYLKLMLKALGITLLTQFISDICRDNGENALALMTETSVKIIVITMLLPLIKAVISIIGGLVK